MKHRTAVRETQYSEPSVPADLLEAFASLPLAEGLDRRASARLAARFDERSYPAGTTIVTEGLQGTDFFVVLSGRAAVLANSRRVAQLGTGDFFGEVGALDEGRRTASVRAETPLRCLVLANGDLEPLLREEPAVALNLLRQLVRRGPEAAPSGGPRLLHLVPDPTG